MNFFCCRRNNILSECWSNLDNGSDSKESACNAGDLGSISGSGRSPWRGECNPLQYPCLGSPMDRGYWWAAVHRVATGWTRLSNTFHLSCWSWSSRGKTWWHRRNAEAVSEWLREWAVRHRARSWLGQMWWKFTWCETRTWASRLAGEYSMETC